MATKLIHLQKAHRRLSPLHLILRGGVAREISPVEANIASQARLRKAAAGGNSSRSSANIVLSQDQSSHSFGVGAGAARLDAAAVVDWDNMLLSWRFGGSRREADGSLLARGRRYPASDGDCDDSETDAIDDSEIEGLLNDEDIDSDEDDFDDDDEEEIAEVKKKGNEGKK